MKIATSPERDVFSRLFILTLFVALAATLPVYADADLTPVDDTDQAALESSASLAFHRYLQAIDAQQLEDANDHAMDPGSDDLRLTVIDRLFAFMRGRVKNPVRNESCIVRLAGDWAMVVYQYDMTIAGKTTRVITTAWMLQLEGYWRQFIVAPADATFWDNRRSDYERLRDWFDEHAEELVSQG